MTEYFIGVIDGTGPFNNSEYKRVMKRSFCKQLSEQAGSNAIYLRGPSGDGYRIEERARRVCEEATKIRGKRIFLAGYSRGGSIAVIAASMLCKLGVGVEALFLFDPVARHLSASSESIPSNVTSVYTARRKVNAPEMDKYDYMLLGDFAGHNPVRNWFGTTATKFDSPETAKNSESVVFIGSHGAIGGVGWKKVKEDDNCQKQTAAFFNRVLRKHGLPANLQAHLPIS